MMKANLNSYLFFWAVLFLLTSCNPAVEMSLQMPVVTTVSIINVTSTTATCESSINYKGSDLIIARGVCWSTKPEPTIKNDTTLNGYGLGSFTSSVINLTAGSTYYVRSYATTANGTWYSNVLQVTTVVDVSLPDPILNPNLTYSTVTDIEGNVYHTITIGSQTWMAENLRVTKYRNGEAIQNETDNTKWKALKTGAYCNYNNNTEPNSNAKFGRLYNFFAVTDKRNLAPTGWHIATVAEWKTLENYLATNLGLSNSIAQALSTTIDWEESTTNGAIGCLDLNTYTSVNNSSGFSALPTGIRSDNGSFGYVKVFCAWWTTTQNIDATSWFRSLNYYGTTLSSNFYNIHYGLSVRCLKD